jgi:hypothetical protein
MFEDDDLGLDDPPRHDILGIKFRGDDFEVVLPYCEVANGDITSVKDDLIEISMHGDGTKPVESVKMTYKDFTELVEKTFDIKEIVKLTLQLANSYDTITIV